MFGYITRDDFACKCGCGFDTYDFETREVLKEVERWFGKSVHITSGCRCDKHNKYIGGVELSKHKEAKAADIWVEDTTPDAVYEYLDKLYPDRYGVGKYRTFTHIDTRADRARW